MKPKRCKMTSNKLLSCSYLLLIGVLFIISETQAIDKNSKDVKNVLESLEILKMKLNEALEQAKELETSFPKPFSDISNYVKNDWSVIKMKVI